MKRIIICFSCVILLCGCVYNTPNAHSKKTTVVTTIFPLYDFARAIGGDKIEIKMLIKPGSEVHSYDPLPSDMSEIYGSDLFLYIGGESDKWVDKLLGGTDINALSLINEVSCGHTHSHGHNHADEHIWTSPQNAVSMLEKICESLSEIDTENSNVYRKNCDEYVEQINAADKQIFDIVSKCKNPFIVVADRYPFEYLTEHYGIDYEAAFDGCAVSTDISLKTMSQLTETIEERNIKTVFVTELSNQNIAKALNKQLGVEIVELHSAHNVSADDFSSGVTYVDIMYQNAKALERGIT